MQNLRPLPQIEMTFSLLKMNQTNKQKRRETKPTA